MKEIAFYDETRSQVAECKDVMSVLEIRNKVDAVRIWAKHAKDKKMEIDAQEMRLIAERKLGELMNAQRDAGLMNKGAQAGGKKESSRGVFLTPRDNNPTLADAGIDKNLAKTARKLAALDSEEFEEKRRSWRQAQEKKSKPVMLDAYKALTSLHTGDEESYTPSIYIESARKVLGAIDLDPASNDYAQKTVKANKFYTVDDDALSLPWRGRIWLNPPYTARVINKFIDCLCGEYGEGRISAAIVLTNNNTDTSWFHQLAEISELICFTSGRINFNKMDGTKSSPTNGQSFFYIGKAKKRFFQEFKKYGLIMEKTS